MNLLSLLSSCFLECPLQALLAISDSMKLLVFLSLLLVDSLSLLKQLHLLVDACKIVIQSAHILLHDLHGLDVLFSECLRLGLLLVDELFELLLVFLRFLLALFLQSVFICAHTALRLSLE